MDGVVCDSLLSIASDVFLVFFFFTRSSFGSVFAGSFFLALLFSLPGHSRIHWYGARGVGRWLFVNWLSSSLIFLFLWLLQLILLPTYYYYLFFLINFLNRLLLPVLVLTGGVEDVTGRRKMLLLLLIRDLYMLQIIPSFFNVDWTLADVID